MSLFLPQLDKGDLVALKKGLRGYLVDGTNKNEWDNYPPYMLRRGEGDIGEEKPCFKG